MPKKRNGKKSARPAALPTEGTKKGSRKFLLPLLLLLNTVTVSTIYFVLLRYVRPEPVLAVYMTVFAAVLIWYICYNRGFYAKNITPKMLPDSMSEDEKTAFIEDVKTREKKSRWMIVFGFPFGFALLFDSLSWLLEDLLSLLSSFF